MSRLLKYGAIAAAGIGAAAYKAIEWKEEGVEEVQDADMYELRTREIEIEDYFQKLEQDIGPGNSKLEFIGEILGNPEKYFYNQGRKEALKERFDELDEFYSHLDNDATEESGR